MLRTKFIARSSSIKAALENGFKFLEIRPLWFFYSSFRISKETFTQSFQVGKAAERTGVAPNLLLQLAPVNV